MTTVTAFANEDLVDYFERVLREARRTNQPVCCHHGAHDFFVGPTMTASDVVTAWYRNAGTDELPARRRA